jgi:hypothetical protein
MSAYQHATLTVTTITGASDTRFQLLSHRWIIPSVSTNPSLFIPQLAGIESFYNFTFTFKGCPSEQSTKLWRCFLNSKLWPREGLWTGIQSLDLVNLFFFWKSPTHVHGLVTSLSYPSTPGHLCLILSLLRVSCPDDSTQGHAWINSQTTLASPPGLIILTEPSAYFLPETSDNPVKPLYVSRLFLVFHKAVTFSRRTPTLSAYLNLITRVFASISNLKHQIR